MQKPRSNFAAVVCNDVIYAIGGSCGRRTMKSVEKYDSETKQWTYVSSMNFERHKHAACVVDEKIIVVGGLDGQNDAVYEIECYDPLKNVWSIVGRTEEAYQDTVLLVV